jgi:hypothetical protein
MPARKHPIRRFFYLLLALLVCFMGYRMYLNYIGYCPEKGRVLTEQEKLAPVIRYLALTHPRDVSPPLIPPKETELYYDSVPEFLRDNPDCCHVVKEFYEADAGWVRLRLWWRLCGDATYLVSVKFYRVFRNQQGEVRKELAQGGYPMTSCGKIVDLIELI